MRLVKLLVQRFQCIESAELELEPHLNVLYGPNDLGKSSLAWAIRAVLLLQHGSSHAARFSSWYGGGEPRVALTFCDDTGRYWRVTKVFGGSAGRSTLESSKDGKTFVAEVSAREVDKRLREILRWGLAAPGGQGRTAMPESFLTQVLLADQTEGGIRDILFEPKLEKDPDESGRHRLIQALGALAQDPLFKKVLDDTTGRVDQAFTATGRRKRTAGSPWVEVAERIKDLRREQEELEAKVKDSAAVEARIRGLHDQRVSLHARWEETAEILGAAQSHLAIKKQRDALVGEAEVCERKVRDVQLLAGQIDDGSKKLERIAAEGTKQQLAAEQAAAAAAEQDGELAILRGELDARVLDDPEADRAAAALETQVVEAGSRVREATTAVGTATEARRSAGLAVKQLASDEDDARKTATIAEDAERLAEEAVRDLERAQHSLDEARELQRSARSNDRAQARELRRRELENGRLTLGARRTQAELSLTRAREIGQQLATVADAEATATILSRSLATSREATNADEVELGKLEAARQGLVRLDTYGRYRQLREQVASASEASEGAERGRARAEELTARADLLRSELRAGLPSSERIAALRSLRESLRVAEAALGGGLSISIRPRRSVELRAMRDGVAEPIATTAEPITFEAKRVLSLGVGDLVDLEITAGEEAARTRAAELRARWLREGEAVLVEHQVASVEDLEATRTRVDAAQREIDDCLREASTAMQRATPAVDIAALREQLAATEVELGTADREDLATRLARLGDPWQSGLQRREKEIEASIEARRTQLETKRAATAKLEAQVDGQQREVQRIRTEVEAAQAALTEPWSVVVATSKADLQHLDTDLADCERQLAGLAGGASDDEAGADAAVAAATAAVETATARVRSAQTDASSARVAQARASTRAEASRAAARALDITGAWTALLDASATELPLAEWERAVVAADEALADARRALLEANTVHTEHRSAREAAVQSIRKRVQESELRVKAARRRGEEAQAGHQQLSAQHSQAVVALSEMRVQVASVNLEETRRKIDDLRARIAALQPADPRLAMIDEAAVAQIERTVGIQRGALRDLDDELARARGALEQVGGAIVRERLDEIGKAIQRAVDREHEIEVEFEAWRLLQTTLRESEVNETAHLGQSLAAPVSERFRLLTAGRYGDLELGAHLEAGGIHVAGDLREIGALSAGTQDQLATLLRVCIAQQLQSAIVLDDHLSQSDPARVLWFNAMLREASEQVQVVLITCRPEDVLGRNERPDEVDVQRTSGPIHAIDLSRVIHRFGGAARPITRGGGS